MIDLIVAQVQREKLIMCEEQFSHHHCPISLDLVEVQIQIL